MRLACGLQVDSIVGATKTRFVRCTIVAMPPAALVPFLAKAVPLVVSAGVATGLALQLILMKDAAQAAAFVAEVRNCPSCSTSAAELQC